MLRRLRHKSDVLETYLVYSRSASPPPRLFFPPQTTFLHSTRGFNAASASRPAEDDSGLKRLPGTPPPHREQTLGEAFAAMQYHGRGTRKVKATVLADILQRVSAEEELKYAYLGLELFKKQGIALTTEAASLFIKACCKAGSPQAAMDALAQAEKYGLNGKSVVVPKRFNYLLSQLYLAGDHEAFARAVEQAKERGQALDRRSHQLIERFEEEMEAKAEEARKAEEEQARKDREEKARVEAEEKARVEAEAEEAKVKKEAEEAEAKRAAAAAAAAAPEGGPEAAVDNAEGVADADGQTGDDNKKPEA